jgi:hypothetical protein
MFNLKNTLPNQINTNLQNIFQAMNDKLATLVGAKDEITRVRESIESLFELQAHFQTESFLESLKKTNRFQDPKRLLQFGFKCFSQNDEDGIIEEIFNRIGTFNKTFIEFGVEDGLESNSAYLLLKGWRGLWIEAHDGKFEKLSDTFKKELLSNQLTALKSFVTKENINDLFQQAKFTGEIDLLSIDIDGNDYHVLNNISVVNPRVLVLEYNANFPASVEWIMKYKADYNWVASSYYGASLKAFENLLNGKYSLVGCNLTGNNAFFVRNDLVQDKFCAPHTSENHYEPLRYWLHLGYQPYKNFRKHWGAAHSKNSEN